MRQVRKDSSGNGVQGGFPKEGMTEGIAKSIKFSEHEIAYLAKRRKELILEGKTDWWIAGVLAGRLERPVVSVYQKIRKLIAYAELGENPNKQNDFSGEEVAKIEKRRAELILEGKNDGQIAGVLVGELKRNAHSIRYKTDALVELGEIGKNPNKKNRFEEGEVAYIEKRRAELILEGKNDGQIARVLAVEMNKPADSIRYKISGLVKSKRLEENPNKQNDFSEEEAAFLKKRRGELILEGKKDQQIGKVLAGEMKRTANSIINKTRLLVKNEELPKNPNKINGFGDEELACLKKRRAELILEGKTDNAIGGILAEEMDGTAKSIGQMISRLIERKKLEDNPNAKTRFSKEEVACIKKRREELILEGRTDTRIARILAGEINRSDNSISTKILRLVERRELRENPNKQGREISEEELAAELSAAVNLYLGDPP